MALQRIASSDELQEGRIIIKDLKRDSVALLRRGGKVIAYLDSCPHRDQPIGPDGLEGDQIVCHLHGACFNADTGKVEEGPARTGLTMFPVTEEEGQVFIDI